MANSATVLNTKGKDLVQASEVKVNKRKSCSYRGSSNDQMGFYDYSFNNNYLLYQNPPANFDNFGYSPANPSTYHDYNSLPSYNHFTPTTSPIFSSSYRHSSATNLPESSKFPSISKTESSQVTNSDSISLEKLHSIITNTSDHVQELNQMCQTKDPKEYEKNLTSKFESYWKLFLFYSNSAIHNIVC